LKPPPKTVTRAARLFLTSANFLAADAGVVKVMLISGVLARPNLEL
jgi:hypothetical protein